MESERRLYKTVNINLQDRENFRSNEIQELRNKVRKEFLINARNLKIQPKEENLLVLQKIIADLKEYALAAEDFRDPVRQFKALKNVRKLLTSNTQLQLPIDAIIESGFLPILRYCLGYEKDELVQFEAAWIITNIATGTTQQTNKIIEADCIPYLLVLLSSKNINISEQAVWAFGNIIGDGPKLRDYITQFEIFEPMLAQIDDNIPLSYLTNISWVTINMCRHQDPPMTLELTEKVLHTISVLINQSDIKIIKNLLSSIGFIADTSIKHIQKIIDSGLVPKLISLLGHNSSDIRKATLIAIGNMTIGSDEQTQYVINAGLLKCLRDMFFMSNEGIRKLICWILSNITAGNMHQIKEVITAELLTMMVSELRSGTFNSKKEIIWAIQNITMKQSKEYNARLIQDGVLYPLCELLGTLDTMLLHLTLGCLRDILQTTNDNILKVKEIMIPTGGLIKLRTLRDHENEDVSSTAEQLLETYFT